MDNSIIESRSIHDTTTSNIIDDPYSTTEREFIVSDSSIISSSSNECSSTELLDLPPKNLVSGSIDTYDVENTAQTSLTGVSSLPKECYDDDDIDEDNDVGSDQDVSTVDSWISLSKLTNINFLKEYEDMLNDQFQIEPTLERSCIGSNDSMIKDTKSKSISQIDITSVIHSNMGECLHDSRNEDKLLTTTQNYSNSFATHDSNSKVPYLIPNVDANDNIRHHLNSQEETDSNQLDNDLDQMDSVYKSYISEHSSNPFKTQVVSEDKTGEHKSYDNNCTVKDIISTDDCTSTYQASTQQLPKSSAEECKSTADTSLVKTIHKFSLQKQDIPRIIPSKEDDDPVHSQTFDIDSNSDNASFVENALESIQQAKAMSQSSDVNYHRIFIHSNQGDSITVSQTAVSQDDTVQGNAKKQKEDDACVDESSNVVQRTCQSIKSVHTDNSVNQGNDNCSTPLFSGTNVSLAETCTEFHEGEYAIAQCIHDDLSRDDNLHSNHASNRGESVSLRTGIDANDLDLNSAIIHSCADSISKTTDSVIERNISRLNLENVKSVPKDSSNDGVDLMGSSDCLQLKASEHLGLCNNDINSLLTRQQYDTQDTTINLESYNYDSSYDNYHANNVAKSGSDGSEQGNATSASNPPRVVAQHDTVLNEMDSSFNHCNTDVHITVAKLEESSASNDTCLWDQSNNRSGTSARKGEASSTEGSISHDADSVVCLSPNEDSQRSAAVNLDVTLNGDNCSGNASVQDLWNVSIQTGNNSQAYFQKVDCSITDSQDKYLSENATISIRGNTVEDRRFNEVHSNSSKSPETSIDEQYNSDEGICLSNHENDQHKTESEGSNREVDKATSDVIHSEDSSSLHSSSIIQPVVQSTQGNLVGEAWTMSKISASRDNSNNPSQKMQNCYANGIKCSSKQVDDSSGSEGSEDSDGTRYPNIYFSTQEIPESMTLVSQRSDWEANDKDQSYHSLHYSVGSYTTQLNDLERSTSIDMCKGDGSNVEQIAKNELDFVFDINHRTEDEQEENNIEASCIASVFATSHTNEADYNESVDDVFRNLHGKSDPKSELQDMLEVKKLESYNSEASNEVITTKNIKFANMSDFGISHQASSSEDSSASTVADSEICIYDQESYAPSPSSTKSGKSKLLDKSQSSRLAMMHTSLSRKSVTGKIIPSIYFDNEMSYTLDDSGSENSNQLNYTNESSRHSSSTDVPWNPSSLQISVASTSQSTDIDILNDSLLLFAESLSKAELQVSESEDPTTFLLPDQRNVCTLPILGQDITPHGMQEATLLPLTSLRGSEEQKKIQEGNPDENTLSCNHCVSPECMAPVRERTRAVETSKISSMNLESSIGESVNRDSNHMHDLSETNVSGLCKNGESPCYPLASKRLLDETSIQVSVTESSNIVLHLPKNETEKRLKEITKKDQKDYDCTIATLNSLGVVSVENGLDTDYDEASKNIFRDTFEILDNSATSNFELNRMFFMVGSDGSPIDNSSLDSAESKTTLYQTHDGDFLTTAVEASEVELSNTASTLSVEAELSDKPSGQQHESQNLHDKSTAHEVEDFEVLCRSESVLAVDASFKFENVVHTLANGVANPPLVTNEAARSTSDEEARESQSTSGTLDERRHSNSLNELGVADFKSTNSNASSLLPASSDASQSSISEASEECKNVELDMIAVQAEYICSKFSEKNQSNEHDSSISSPIRLSISESVWIESSDSIKNMALVNNDEILPEERYEEIREDCPSEERSQSHLKPASVLKVEDEESESEEISKALNNYYVDENEKVFEEKWMSISRSSPMNDCSTSNLAKASIENPIDCKNEAITGKQFKPNGETVNMQCKGGFTSRKRRCSESSSTTSRQGLIFTEESNTLTVNDHTSNPYDDVVETVAGLASSISAGGDKVETLEKLNELDITADWTVLVSANCGSDNNGPCSDGTVKFLHDMSNMDRPYTGEESSVIATGQPSFKNHDNSSIPMYCIGGENETLRQNVESMSSSEESDDSPLSIIFLPKTAETFTVSKCTSVHTSHNERIDSSEKEVAGSMEDKILKETFLRRAQVEETVLSEEEQSDYTGTGDTDERIRFSGLAQTVLQTDGSRKEIKELSDELSMASLEDDASNSAYSIEDEVSESMSLRKEANKAAESSEEEETDSSDTRDEEEPANMELQATIPKLRPMQGEQQEAMHSSEDDCKKLSTNDESSKSSSASTRSDVVEKSTQLEKPLVAEFAKSTVATRSALLSAARAQSRMVKSSPSESEGSSDTKDHERVNLSLKMAEQNESDSLHFPRIEDTIRRSNLDADPRFDVDSELNVNAAESVLENNVSLRDTETFDGMPTPIFAQTIASHPRKNEVTQPQAINVGLDLEAGWNGIETKGNSKVVKLKECQSLVAGEKLPNESLNGTDRIRIAKVQEVASSTSPVVDNLNALPKVSRHYDALEHSVLLSEGPTKAIQSKKVKAQHPVLNFRSFNTPDDSFSSIGNSITESSINLDKSFKRICHDLVMVQEEGDGTSNVNHCDKVNFEGSPQEVRSIDQGFLDRTIDQIDKVLVESLSNIDPKILKKGNGSEKKIRFEESDAFTDHCTMECHIETGKTFDLVLFLRGQMVPDIELNSRIDPPLYEEELVLTDPSCGVDSDASTSSEYLIWQDKLQNQRSLIAASRQLHPDPPAEGLGEWTGLDPPDDRFFTTPKLVDSATVMSYASNQSEVMKPSDLDDQADHSEGQSQHCSNTLHKNSFEMPDNETYILRQQGYNESGTSVDTASAESNDVEMGGRMPCSERKDTTLSIDNGRLLRIPSIVLLVASSCFMLALTAIVIPFALYDGDDAVQVANAIRKPSSFPNIGLSTPPVSTPPSFAPTNEAIGGWDLLASFTGIVDAGFASTVAVSDNLFIIGSPVSSNGTVQCFYSISSNQWVGVQQIHGNDVGSGFGSAIGLKKNRLIVGAPLTREPTNQATIGAAYAYTYNEIGVQLNPVGLPLNGEEIVSPSVTGEEFGSAVATSSGFRLAVGAPGNSLLGKDTGRIYTYEYRIGADSRSWMKMEKNALLGTTSGDRFGSSIDLSADGNILIAGAPGRRLDDSKFFSSHGFALIYRWSTNDWQFQVVLQGDENGEGFGSSVISLSDGGEYLAVGAPGFRNGAGRIKVYQYNAANFSYNQFGSDVVGDFGEELGLARTISGIVLDETPLIFASTALGVTKRFDYNAVCGGWEQRPVSLPDSHGKSLVVGIAVDGSGVTAVVGDHMMARSYVYHVNDS